MTERNWSIVDEIAEVLSMSEPDECREIMRVLKNTIDVIEKRIERLERQAQSKKEE